MFAATRRWFRRNRTPIAIGLGVVGAGYVATQYILNKLNDARERMSSDRIAKENLRRRFQQNQEDCTYTVLALLPTATAKILEAMDVEKITLEIQQMKGGAAKSVKSGNGDSISLPETTGLTDEDGRSMVSASGSGVHASQITIPPASQTSEGGEQPQPEKPRRTKRQLWGDVTISSITRAYTLIYTLGLLTMLTRVQLNLLGRRSYLSSVVSLATGSNSAAISLENNDDDNSTQAYGDDFEVNRKYLTFSWWLLNKGWVDVMQRVEAAVRQVFGQMSPRDQLSFETFASMTGQVRRLVEGSASFSDPQSGDTTTNTPTPTKWLPFLLPPPDMEDHVLKESGILDDSAASVTQTQQDGEREPSSPTSTASLRRLLDETSDLVDSPTFTHVLTQILDTGFSALLENKLAMGAFEIPPPQNPPPAVQVINGGGVSPELQELRAGKKVLLPKCLSVLTRQAHAIGSGMPENEYLQAMEAVQDLEGFAAVVYSSNWENEIREEAAAVPTSSSSGSGRAGSTTAESSVRQSQVLIGPGEGEESLVLVDPSQSSFESAWAKATEGPSQP
ncbi:Peroxisomal biogenesis factor 3 [Cytospora mali]|uniref:Peroxisomal biogenesis factor 3 n=1 Tax=Cytospora mali TaxID=578113 RepID=A0A194V7K5_CYTMA|nr:Peroxisomal biogenesis factor 3 [Valsa mali var. pyri (nom. inval.)]